MFKSISSKLIISFFTASILVLFALSTVTLYSLKHHFFQQDKYNSEQKFKTINLLQLQDDFIAKYGAYFELGETKFWLIKEGRVTYQTQETPLPQPFLINQHLTTLDWTDEANTFRAFRFSVKREANTYVILGININHQLNFLNSFTAVLFWTTLFASIVSGFLGWLIVKRGMLPVKQLEGHLQKISTNRLDLRLDPKLFPNELQQLVTVSNDMLSRLEHEFERLSEFSSDIAHELRTPISNMMTQTQVMLAKPRNTEEYRESLISTMEELSRLAKIITDMLYLAKSEHNLLQIANVDIALYDLLEGIVEYYELAGEEKALTLTLSGDATVNGDREMLKRAVGNLVSNAVRHSDPNETISISINNLGSEVEVAVRNVGETISHSHLPYLFERFYRVDKARMHRATAGAGLGLAIARSIARCHHGDITVTSSNHVTVFSLSIPK
ncbi:heavy metal sensor histidine kinase [Photobacterium minamisatsumaniensis]|uniref:heavy metal sensor histidine kinase n=1 Tax=Photobacterium minamisatsumaniensis TaxID=2910233 RepID=UPI003D1392D6